jgi:hypothetical protein
MTVSLETLLLPMKTEDNAFRASLSRVTQLVGAAIQAVEGMIKASFKWADELDSITDIMDVSTRSAAAYNFVLRKSGTATETFTKGMVILGKGLVDANGKLDTTGKALKEWGVDVLDSNKMLKDQETLIGEVAEKYATFATQQEKVNFLTEVFGKSGAELVDFFDTLAAEGGIDAVTKKVQELGLAIDPDRYEQFNRNLEELKLIGLGIAVGFTEKLMPILENLTKWIMEKGIPGFMRFKDQLISEFQDGGIGEALEFIDDAIAEHIDNIDWSGLGTQFGDLLEGMLTNASGEIDIPASLETLTQGIQDFLIAAVGEENLQVVTDAFNLWAQGLPSGLDFLDEEFNAKFIAAYDLIKSTNATRQAEIQLSFQTMMDNVGAKVDAGLLAIDTNFANWSIGVVAKAKVWGSDMLASFNTSMSNLQATMARFLANISENFQTRARSWINKAVESFNGQKQALVDAVQGLVNDINAVLKKVITSFQLVIKPPIMGTSSTSNLGGDGGSTNENKPGRASGGPVISGQSYTVFDTHQDEILRAGASGRIDALSRNSQPVPIIVMNWDQFDIPFLASEIVKGINNT